MELFWLFDCYLLYGKCSMLQYDSMVDIHLMSDGVVTVWWSLYHWSLEAGCFTQCFSEAGQLSWPCLTQQLLGDIALSLHKYASTRIIGHIIQIFQINIYITSSDADNCIGKGKKTKDVKKNNWIIIFLFIPSFVSITFIICRFFCLF